MKKVGIFLLSIVLVLSLSSCGIITKLIFEEKKSTTSYNTISRQDTASRLPSNSFEEKVSSASDSVSSEESVSSEVDFIDELDSTVYGEILKERYKTTPRLEFESFMLRDLTGDGEEELICKYSLLLTIYSPTGEKLGEHDFVTGTTQFFLSENPDYPGFFVYHIGGGVEFYDYIGVKNNTVVFENLWSVVMPQMVEHMPDREQYEEHTDDQEIIAESKVVFGKEGDYYPFIEKEDDWNRFIELETIVKQ